MSLLMLLASFSLAQGAAPPPIINGESADERVFPMTGALLVSADYDYGGTRLQYEGVMCSSTLIAPDVVLLAAHCVDPEIFTHGMGEMISEEFWWSRQADLTAWDGNHKVISWPEDAIVGFASAFHPAYADELLSMGVGVNFDVGLLFLRTPVTDVSPAVLITQDERDQVVEGAKVSVVGWGQQVATQGGASPPAGTFAIKMWGESTLGEVGEAEFVVGTTPSAVRKCHGDSGGPTFMEVQTDSAETLREIGLASHVYDLTDCDSLGAVDTRVDDYLTWIDDEMRARCADGTRSWCEQPGILPPPPPETEDTAHAEGHDGEEVALACGCASSPAGDITLAVAVAGFFGARRRGVRPEVTASPSQT